jgi:hypothetical protein
MAERPILFSAPMVRAILEGRKSQTRRIVRPQPPTDHQFLQDLSLENECEFEWTDRDTDTEDLSHWPSYEKALRPKWQPGDLLWVRETWGLQQGEGEPFAVYRADWPETRPGGWRPSIFMPKWACRIWLDVTGVRVERLIDISHEDARAEGCEDTADSSVRGNYAKLWTSINGAGSWDANPWVWVIDFKLAERKAVAA